MRISRASVGRRRNGQEKNASMVGKSTPIQGKRSVRPVQPPIIARRERKDVRGSPGGHLGGETLIRVKRKENRKKKLIRRKRKNVSKGSR